MKPLIVSHVTHHNPPDQKLIAKSSPSLSPVTPFKLRKFHKPPIPIIFGIPLYSPENTTPGNKKKKMISNKEMSTVKGKKYITKKTLQGKNLGKGKNTKYTLKTTPKDFLLLKTKSYFLSSS
jgi:hypothetical protein